MTIFLSKRLGIDIALSHEVFFTMIYRVSDRGGEKVH